MIPQLTNLVRDHTGQVDRIEGKDLCVHEHLDRHLLPINPPKQAIRATHPILSAILFQLVSFPVNRFPLDRDESGW